MVRTALAVSGALRQGDAARLIADAPRHAVQAATRAHTQEGCR